MKCGMIIKKVSRMQPKKNIGSDICMHVSTMHINVHACFQICQQLLNSVEFADDEEN